MKTFPGQRFDRIEAAMPYKPQSRALDPRDVQIKANWNVRDMKSPAVRDHINGIKESIRQRIADGLPGLIKPIEVTYDRGTGVTDLVDGECRLTACRELWDEGLEVYVASKVVEGSDDQLFATALASNSGRAYTDVEIAEGIRRLNVGQLWSPTKIARHICRPLRYVTDALALAGVPEEAKQLLNEGAVTKDAVLHAVKGKDGDSLGALKERAADRLKAQPPAQASIPGTPAPRGKAAPPVARPKKPSAQESIAKSDTGMALTIGIDLARLVLEDYWVRRDLEIKAKAYLSAVGLEK